LRTRLDVSVKPGCRKPGIGVRAGVVTISVRERAVEGTANAAVLCAVAEWLGVPPSHVTLVRGRTSRRKLLEIEGLSEEVRAAKLAALGK